jgi:hypothetical protein
MPTGDGGEVLAFGGRGQGGRALGAQFVGIVAQVDLRQVARRIVVEPDRPAHLERLLLWRRRCPLPARMSAPSNLTAHR